MAKLPEQPSISSSGASLHNITWSKRISAWMAHHQLVSVETLLRLLHYPLGSLLTWLVIAIALTLPGALWMAVDNLEQLSGRFQESGRITLYLSEKVSSEQGQHIAQRVASLESVQSVQFVDADAVLDEFRQHSGLDAALDFLESNPLPAIILVEPPLGLDQQQTRALLEQLKNESQVDSVQVDMAWVERMHSILALSETVIVVLGSLLSLAIILVVGNTIRLDIAARVDEIRVVKLVGGTNAWVRRPFLYTGLWYGFVGGLLAWLMMITCWLILKGPVADLAMLYGSDFRLKPLAADAALVLLLAAMLLGWLGAWWSVRRHLNRIEP